MSNPDECEICLDKYSIDNKPKCLPCGHSICTNCTSWVYTSKKACPICRSVFKCPLESIPINFSLLALLNNDLASKHNSFLLSISEEPNNSLEIVLDSLNDEKNKLTSEVNDINAQISQLEELVSLEKAKKMAVLDLITEVTKKCHLIEKKIMKNNSKINFNKNANNQNKSNSLLINPFADIEPKGTKVVNNVNILLYFLYINFL